MSVLINAQQLKQGTQKMNSRPNRFRWRDLLPMLGLTAALAAISVSPNAANADMPGDGISIQPISTGRADHYFQHFVVQITLERLGYDVKEHLEAQFPAMHLALGQGDADYTAVHWDPLHQKFFDKSGGDEKLVRVGKLIEGAQQGYLVDKKTADRLDLNNLSQFSDPTIAKAFDSNGNGKANLTGCNPGWGCEGVIEHQLDAYELRDVIEHDQGAYFALVADTITRYQAGQSILYYTWTPLWVSSVLKPGTDTVWLNVPFSSLPGERDDVDTGLPDGRNPGFEVNTIRILANKEFLSDKPAARKLFEVLSIPIADVNAAILRQHEGETDIAQIRGHAEEWIRNNSSKVDDWIAQAASAAQ